METLPELARIRKNVNVIVSSGYSKEDASECFSTLRPAGFIQKPYTSSDLIRLVAHAIEQSKTAT